MGVAEVGVAQVGPVEVLLLEGHRVRIGAFQVGVVRLRVGQEARSDDRAGQLGLDARDYLSLAPALR